MIRKLFDIRSTALLLALAFVALVTPPDGASNGLPVADSELAVFKPQTYYPMGWFDHLNAPERLPSMRAAGMNVVMPYTGDLDGNLKTYLDGARRQGIKVFVQIDPLFLIAPNPVLVRQFVEQYKKHPAVFGWLLVDEPTVHSKYDLVNPQNAEMLYNQIKAADPKHPVAIVFGISEDPKPFLRAMDILMYDDYVQADGMREFWGLDRWRARLIGRAAMAKSLDGYIPVLQAFGEDHRGNPQIKKRLPTSNEMRYITYTAMQYDSTGLFFWVRYRSRADWIAKVLTPLSKEIAPTLRAVAGRPRSGVSVVGSGVKATLFRDTAAKKNYLVVVHHGGGTVTRQINVSSSLNVVKAFSKEGSHDVSDGKLIDTFGPYAARLYRLT